MYVQIYLVGVFLFSVWCVGCVPFLILWGWHIVVIVCAWTWSAPDLKMQVAWRTWLVVLCRLFNILCTLCIAHTAEVGVALIAMSWYRAHGNYDTWCGSWATILPDIISTIQLQHTCLPISIARWVCRFFNLQFKITKCNVKTKWEIFSWSPKKTWTLLLCKTFCHLFW